MKILNERDLHTVLTSIHFIDNRKLYEYFELAFSIKGSMGLLLQEAVREEALSRKVLTSFEKRKFGLN